MRRFLGIHVLPVPSFRRNANSFEHCIIVGCIVTSDMSDLEQLLALNVEVLHNLPYVLCQLGQQSCTRLAQGVAHCVSY